MTYPNHEIPQLVKELDGYDQVVGARTSEQGTAKFARVPAKWLIRKLASYLVETKIPDLNSGLRAFRADVGRQYLNQLPPGFSCVTTLTLSFLANGYSVKYVPIEYSERAGNSKFHWWKDTRRYLTQVVRMVLSYNPLRVFMPVALLLLAIGVGKLVVRRDRVRPPDHDQHVAVALRRVPAPRDRVARRPLRPTLETQHRRGSRVAVSPR